MALPASPSTPLLWNHQPRDSHWKWFAVDVTKEEGQLVQELEPEDVLKIRRELRAYTWTAQASRRFSQLPGDVSVGKECTEEQLDTIAQWNFGHAVDLVGQGLVVHGAPVQLRDPDFVAKVVKLRELQTQTAAWHAEHFADEEVVVQEHIGTRSWRLIVRVPAKTPLARRLENSDRRWSTDMLAVFSGPAALKNVGAAIGNDDLPVKFTGPGGVAGDFLVHTTLYERFSGFCSTVPESIFEVTEEGKMTQLLDSNGNLKPDFYFNDKGQIQDTSCSEGSHSTLADYYYALVVTKGWWTSVVSWAVVWTVFIAVDWYNNVTFLAAVCGTSTLSVAFGVAIVLFFLLESYFCWLLARGDMQLNVHNNDMAMDKVQDPTWTEWLFTSLARLGRGGGQSGEGTSNENESPPQTVGLYPFQTLLYYFRIPAALKDIVIWTCPRGANMGRAVVKVRGARVHVLTWPSKAHYQCDFMQGKHKVLPLLLIKNMVLVIIQSTIILDTGNFVAFSAYFWPKLLIWLFMLYNYFLDCRPALRALKGWLTTNMAKPTNNSKQQEVLEKVFRTHFGDGDERCMLAAVLPKHPGYPFVPISALVSTVVIVFLTAICCMVVDWIDE